MKSVTGRELWRALGKRGWVLVRIRGSHHHFESPDGRIKITLPIHGNEAVPKGLLIVILKQTGLKESDL